MRLTGEDRVSPGQTLAGQHTLNLSNGGPSMVQRLIAQEIADKYGRSLVTVRRWMASDAWPAPLPEKRGRWLEFDADAVDEAYRKHFGRDTADAGDPDELLTPAQIVEHTGLAAGTVRADISRGRFGEPDEDKNGVRRWKRSTVDAKMAERRPRRR
ncbi:helix-turn-helix transcriptional regulator [Nocardia sp. CA-145437]|uniref:helix-turn-helix transcriptional regulator n=1 Tax=Nocardia sp. CA-145437 TaxID=3239980 RepID=UPI003D9567BC